MDTLALRDALGGRRLKNARQTLGPPGRPAVRHRYATPHGVLRKGQAGGRPYLCDLSALHREAIGAFSGASTNGHRGMSAVNFPPTPSQTRSVALPNRRLVLHRQFLAAR